MIGTTPVSRAFNSKREFLEGAVNPLTARLAAPIKPTLRLVVAEGDCVVVQWDGRATAKSGTPYDNRS